jgi:endonuclease YncB( thermonuclease family)
LDAVITGVNPLRSIFPRLLIALLATTASPAVAAAPDHARFTWPVIGIKDGDTLTVNLPGLPASLNPVAIRLRSVDTPESGGRARCASERKLAERATHFTRQAIATASNIEFESPSWDKYGGRIDADVWIDGRLLSEQLIAAGLARRYNGGRRAGWC